MYFYCYDYVFSLYIYVWLPWLDFPCFFLSCKANASVKLAKAGHGPHSSTLVVICFVRLLFVLFYVLFVCKCVLPPTDNPIAVNKYIISHISLLTLLNRVKGRVQVECLGVGRMIILKWRLKIYGKGMYTRCFWVSVQFVASGLWNLGFMKYLSYLENLFYC